jgi:hypothetical protein
MNKVSPRPQMRLPMQSAPIARMPGSAALNRSSGMEPSAWWDDLIKTAAPAVISGLSGLI